MSGSLPPSRACRNRSFLSVSATRGNAPAPVGIRPRHRRSPSADGETKRRLLGGASPNIRYDETRRAQRNGAAHRVASLIPTHRARKSLCCIASFRRPSWRGAGRRRGVCCDIRREAEGTPASPTQVAALAARGDFSRRETAGAESGSEAPSWRAAEAGALSIASTRSALSRLFSYSSSLSRTVRDGGTRPCSAFQR
jgi:hypothetical protein